MPHYLLELMDTDEEAPLFAIYSTIVDNLLTEPMTATEALAYIKADERYAAWLKPYDAEETIREHGANWSEGMLKIMREQARYFYYHRAGFCCAKESDSYFCLPRHDWRND